MHHISRQTQCSNRAMKETPSTSIRKKILQTKFLQKQILYQLLIAHAIYFPEILSRCSTIHALSQTYRKLIANIELSANWQPILYYHCAATSRIYLILYNNTLFRCLNGAARLWTCAFGTLSLTNGQHSAHTRGDNARCTVSTNMCVQ